MPRPWAAAGSEVLKHIHDLLVTKAQDNGVIAGERMRVDTSGVETNIHHSTDSTLRNGVRVQTGLEGLREDPDRMLPLVLEVMRQTGPASSTATLLWKMRFSACSIRRPSNAGKPE
ncbi:hypothetical protein ABIB06_007800 [Bradyrhizobium sp. LB8.2]